MLQSSGECCTYWTLCTWFLSAVFAPSVPNGLFLCPFPHHVRSFVLSLIVSCVSCLPRSFLALSFLFGHVVVCLRPVSLQSLQLGLSTVPYTGTTVLCTAVLCTSRTLDGRTSMRAEAYGTGLDTLWPYAAVQDQHQVQYVFE